METTYKQGEIEGSNLNFSTCTCDSDLHRQKNGVVNLRGRSPLLYFMNYIIYHSKVGNRLQQVKTLKPKEPKKPKKNNKVTDKIIITDYVYNDANQLTDETTDSETTNYEYDANGNQTKKTKGTEVSNWTYDFENRQITYQDPLNSGLYVYNAAGTRIQKTAAVTVFNSGGQENASDKIGVGNGKGQGQAQGQGTENALETVAEIITTTEKYVYDGANVIVDYDGSNNVKASYVTPFLDQNLIMVRGDNTYYYTQDGLGSVREVLGANQVVKNSYDYYAFGEALNWSKTVPNRYTFTAREWDKESQTSYYRERQYNPFVGRFTRRDPIGYVAGLNLYGYVGNSSVNYRDPLGLRSMIEDVDPTIHEQFLEYRDPFDLGQQKLPERITPKGPRVKPKAKPKLPDASLPGNPDVWGRANNPTTSGENWIVVTNPLDFLDASAVRDEATRLAAASGYTGAHLGPQDAYRHCVGSCLLSNRIGCCEAEKFGTAHENSNPAAFIEDNRMDLHNNARGRQISNAGLDCDIGCRAALENGTLRIVEPLRRTTSRGPYGTMSVTITAGKLVNSDKHKILYP